MQSEKDYFKLHQRYHTVFTSRILSDYMWLNVVRKYKKSWTYPYIHADMCINYTQFSKLHNWILFFVDKLILAPGTQ